MGCFSGNFYSEELKTTTRINLILPDASNDVTPLLGGTPKLLFLLHGLGGNCDEWLRFSKIEYYAKKFNLIVVMPEAQRSFYCDYPTAPRYFHYVADELPQLCEQWFALRRPRLIQLCGTEDFLYEHNRRFRLAAEEAGYGHCYREGPGEHAWPYWDRAIQTALRFFLGLETDGEFY